MSAPPGTLFGVSGPDPAILDTIAATVVVGNTLEGDIAGITCHVRDDIAAGIALLPAGGGTLHIKRGSYAPAATLAIPSTVNIQGEGPSTVVQKPAGEDLFFVDGQQAIRISNLSMDGQGDLTGGHLLNIQNSEQLFVWKCTLYDNPGGDGIHVEGSMAVGRSAWVMVEESDIQNCLRGFYSESNDDDPDSCIYMAIHYCSIYNCLEEGLFCYHCKNTTLIGTLIQVNGTSGVFDNVLFRGKNVAEKSSGHTIFDGWFFGATGNGVVFDRVNSSTAQSVQSFGNGVDSIQLINESYFCTFRGCQTGSTVNGIYIDSTSAWNSIIGCICLDPGVGVLVGADFTEVVGCNVNFCGGNGIQIDGHNCIVSSNNSNGNGGHGIYITGDRNTVNYNTPGDHTGWYPNAGDGIRIAATGDRNIIIGNQCLGNTGAPITNFGTNSLIANNIIL